MAIQVVMVSTIEVVVPVDPGDMGKSAWAPGAIDAAAADLRNLLPEGSSVKTGLVKMRRRRLNDDGGQAGRDSAAKSEDTELTPLEKAIRDAAASALPAPEADLPDDAAGERMGEDEDPSTPGSMQLAGEQPARGAVYTFGEGLPDTGAAQP